MMEAHSALQQGLARIRHNFLYRLSDYAIDLLAFDAAPDSIELVDKALFALHKISGSAATLGYADLGAQAKRAEEMLRGDLTRSAYPSAASLNEVRVVYSMSQEILDTSL